MCDDCHHPSVIHKRQIFLQLYMLFICAPVIQGGLGVCDLRTFNKALLGKWLWRYHSEGGSLWKEITDARYGATWGGWCSNKVRGGYCVGLWKFIRSGWSCFERNVRFVVGDGNLISFWRDVWCGDHALERVYPTLFRIATNREASVAYVRLFLHGVHQWNVLYIRDFHDWELPIVSDFRNLLYSMRTPMTQCDRLK
ncbi:hypothetical protein I3842_03G129400 [Carya illinoinensis]|uniref:Reverse transcriptase zinc-binding domain-containing protein n=1 Tax=Carya illinoinensis TaxID=32201 RepID=A0A922FLH7_CARIL|nr:hypothetical protein I3842_03G129400 [Carya illinoinensis]